MPREMHQLPAFLNPAILHRGGRSYAGARGNALLMKCTSVQYFSILFLDGGPKEHRKGVSFAGLRALRVKCGRQMPEHAQHKER